MTEPAEYERYRHDAATLVEIGRHLASLVPSVEVTIPGHLAVSAAAAWERDEEGPVGQETVEQTQVRHLAGDLALFGLTISEGAQPVDQDVMVALPVYQFAAAVKAWVESH